jgi:hypothetical protein
MQVRLRLMDQIGATVRQQAGQRRINLHDYLRHLIERGLFVDLVSLSRVVPHVPSPLAPYYLEAILETRNLLRSLVAARDPQAVIRAQADAKSEAEKLSAQGRTHVHPTA